MSDDYDSAVAASMQPEPAQAARIGFAAATDTNPDAYAEAQRVARRTGVPVDTVFAMPQEMKRQDQMGSIDFDALAKTSPATAALLSDVEKAKITHDDVDNLTKIEGALYALGKFEVGTAKAVASAVPKFNEGAWGVARAGADLLPDFVGKPLSDKFAQYGKSQRDIADGMLPKSSGLIENSWYSGMQSLGLNALLLPAAVASGGSSVPVLAGMGLSQGGQSYGEARDAGVPVPQSLAFGTSQGVIEAGTEMIGLPALLSTLKPGKFMTKALEYLVKEQGGEQIATHLQDLNEWAVLHPENSIGDYLSERPSAALQTALSTVFSGGGQLAVVKGIGLLTQQKGQEAERAGQMRELLSGLNKLAEANKLRLRDADTARGFFQSALDEGRDAFYITPDALAQSGLAEQMAQAIPAVQEQLQTAAESGHDIRIPIADLMAQMAGPELEQSLIPHLAKEPGGFTQTTAQEWLQSGAARELQAEVEHVLTEKEGDDTFKASTEAIKADLKAQLDTAARFTPAVNDAYAAMVSNFYAVQAARSGTTPEEMFKRYPLKINAESIAGGQVLNQFAGVNSRTADRLSLSAALSRLTKKESAERVRADTGWSVGVDGKLRYEIPDNEAKLSNPPIYEAYENYATTREREQYGENFLPSSLSDSDYTGYQQFLEKVKEEYDARNEEQSLGTLLNHPKLFAAYPDLASIKVRFLRDAPFRGAYYPKQDRIDIVLSEDRDKVLSTLLHEVQHAIQHREDFATGGSSSENFATAIKNALGSLENRSKQEVEHWKWQNKFKIDKAEEAATVARYGLMYESAQRLIDYSNRDKPSGVLRLIRNELQWIYLSDFKDNDVAREISYDFYGIPKSHKMRERNAYLSDMAFKGARMLLDHIPEELRNQFKSDPRTMKGMLEALQRESDRKRRDLAPLRALEDNARSAEIVNGAHRYSTPYEVYRALAGEVEARNTQARQNMSEEERAKSSPVSTQDIRPEQVVVMFGGLDIQAPMIIGNYGHSLNQDARSIEGEQLGPALYQSSTSADSARRDELFSMPPVDARFNDAENADFAAAKKSAKAKYSALQKATEERGFGVTTTDGREVKFSGAGFKEATHHAADRRVLSILANLDALFTSAVPIYSEAAQGKQQVKAFHYYGAKADFGNLGEAYVLLEVIERENGEFFYDADATSVDEILAASSVPLAAQSKTEAGNEVVASKGRLAAWISGVNNSDVLYQKSVENRGSFDPETLSITLLKNADLSTFLHESGHFFLVVQAGLAAQLQQDADIHGFDTLKPGERQILADTQALLDWFGIKSLAEWNNLDFEERRSYHEQFARGFEKYLFEGKAPSIELQGLFQRFRAWLLNVYRDLKALNVEITDEVRGVFDRMLATTEQIKLAEQGRSMMPLFASPDQAGMTPDEFAEYQALGTDATNEAIQDLQARGLRDMQWLHNARGRIIKQLQKAAKAQRAEVQMEVRGEVMSEPIYQAWQYLTAKEIEGGEPVGKLSRSALAEMYGGHDASKHDKYALLDWKRLTDLRMTAEEGEHPDMVAERFGFSSGDELVRKLLAAEKPDVEIDELTDVRMLEQLGELSSPEAIEKAADKAIHNDVRARMIATELNALAKATGQRKTLASAAKEYAEAMIARLKVRNIKPGQYTSAEVRAGKAAEKSSKAGDLTTAAAEKRNQLINAYATRAAYDVQTEVEKIVRYFKAIDKSKTLPADYLAQIQMLLDKYDLRAQSGAAIDRKTSLRTWVQSRLNLGEIPAISESLLSPAERKAYDAEINSRDEDGNLVYPDDDERIKLLADAVEASAKRHYKDLTVEELRGLNDTVKQIEHLGRLKDKLMTKLDGAGYAATRDLLAATVEANAKDQNKNQRTDNTWLGGKIDALAQFGVSHIKPAIWMRIFDGGQDNGPWWSTIVRPANERATFETSRRAAATRALMEILGPVLQNVSYLDQIGKGRFFPTLGEKVSLNWQERMAFAFNYGNESNLQRLMGGGIAGVTKTLSMGQIQTVLNTLSAAEWHAVQAVWDYFETFRPEIAAKALRVYGAEPKWIDARKFTIKTSDGETLTLRGGYFPVKFDAKTNLKAQQHSDAQAAKDVMKAAYSAATTQRSFTKERVEEVTGRPLLLNLSGLYSGINDVIHDLAWHEWVIDVNRLLRSESIDSAIREHYGANVKRELTKWRDDIVAGSARLDHGLENAAGWVRKFVSSSALTYNVKSALMQPLGITQSFSRVGAKWVGIGLGQYVSGPIEATRMVQGKSEFMTNRTRTMFRDINELRNRVAGQTTGRELMGRYGYFLTMHFQMMVDVPTWIGAYEKALAGGHADDVAIALADQSVKDSQGGGEEVDQSGITRGGPVVKLFTAFYDFMNTQANVLYLKNATATSRADAWMNMALVGLVTPMLAAALGDALIPGDSGDWDDWEKIVKKLLSEGLGNLIGMVAFGREFTQAAKALYGDDKGIGYSGPAGLRVIPDAGKLAKQINQGEVDDAFRKSFINVVGDLSGIPAVQINRTITGANALSSGDTDNPTALVFGFQKKH